VKREYFLVKYPEGQLVGRSIVYSFPNTRTRTFTLFNPDITIFLENLSKKLHLPPATKVVKITVFFTGRTGLALPVLLTGFN
jgi:hypothetical protein